MGSPDKLYAPAPSGLKESPPLSYGRLRQRNPHYDGHRMAELHDLYAGGYDVLKRAPRLLTRLTGEHTKRFEERCITTAYIGYFGQVVEQFTSDLFAQPLSIMVPADADDPKTPGDPPSDFYREFERDCDLEGTKFVDLLKDVLTTALVQRDAFVCVDARAPDPGERPPVSRAEEEARGNLRLYAYEVSPREVVDWKEDRSGGYEWVIVNRAEQDRPTPWSVRDQVRETFIVWTLEDAAASGALSEVPEASGAADVPAGVPRSNLPAPPKRVAVWRRYEIVYDAEKTPDDKDSVRYVDGGATNFPRIPLLRLRLPKGLWVGNIIGPVQKEHWQRRSALNSAQGRSMAAIPVIARGPEIGARGGAQPSETQEDPERGRDPMGTFTRTGWVETGADDKVYFAEPEGKCYAQVAKELDELKDEIFRVVHQMAASVKPSAGALGRSAASKQQDGKLTALVLRALGKEVREFALAVYRLMTAARKEGDTMWVASGLDNYELIDRQEILEEALSIDLVDIPSETFAITLATQVAEKLLTGMDPATLATIRKEIEDGIRERFKQKALEAEAKTAATEAEKAALEAGGAPGEGGKPEEPPGTVPLPVKPKKKQLAPEDARA